MQELCHAHSQPNVSKGGPPAALDGKGFTRDRANTSPEGVADGSRRPVADRRWPPAGSGALRNSVIAGQSLENDDGKHVEAECSSSGVKHFLLLALGATGVVFGDIGTSPLYTFTGIFVDALHEDMPTPIEVTRAFSMIFWTLTWVVCLKYVFLVLRVSHHGEGGTFALMQRILLAAENDGIPFTATAKSIIVFLSMLGCAFIAGDGCITPVISVLGAVEGIPAGVGVNWHVAIAICTLVVIFMVQRRGSHVIGMCAGPVMTCWFVTIAMLGVYNIIKHPEEAKLVLGGLSPVAVYNFWTRGEFSGVAAWRSLAGVALSVTGAEALYADMGHFGSGPISLSWFALVYPCLVLQFVGQATALCVRPEGVSRPLFNTVPDGLQWPMVVLATLATMIASQAMISGLFSLLTQAHALEFLPRILVMHPNPNEQGQVYIPEVNWFLCVMCIAICFFYKTSSALAGAYGIAVTSTFLVTTAMMALVFRYVWHWPLPITLLVIIPMLVLDVALWSANVLKLVDSGWVPVLIAVVFCTLMHTHLWGRRQEQSVMAREAENEAAEMKSNGSVRSLATLSTLPALQFVLGSSQLVRTEKTAVFLTPYSWRVPRTVGTLAELVGSLPKTLVLLSVRFEDVPFVSEEQRASFVALGAGLFSVTLHFGYAEPLTPERLAVHKALAQAAENHAIEHPELAPLIHLDRLGNCMLNDDVLTGVSEDLESHVVEGHRLREHEYTFRNRGPAFVLHKLSYAVQPGPCHGFLDRLRIALYSFIVLNARQPISFFGLQCANTLELSVVRFL
jgi:KUP system potassium uptake protein